MLTAAPIVMILIAINAMGVLQIIHMAPNGSTGDWYNLAQVDPASPYAFEQVFRWAPIAAWVWHYGVDPLGFASEEAAR